jgi:hypothetical protein
MATATVLPWRERHRWSRMPTLRTLKWRRRRRRWSRTPASVCRCGVGEVVDDGDAMQKAAPLAVAHSAP